MNNDTLQLKWHKLMDYGQTASDWYGTHVYPDSTRNAEAKQHFINFYEEALQLSSNIISDLKTKKTRIGTP